MSGEPIEIVKLANGEMRGFGNDNDYAYKRFKAYVKRMEAGELLSFSWKKPRNPQHHKKFMALVTYVKDNSDTFDTKKKALTAVKIAAGHVEWEMSPVTGELVPIPKSISFDSMDQNEFDNFYSDAIDGVVKHILPHLNRVDLQTALDQVNRFA